MDLPLEVDSRGRDTDNDPRYYVITDRFGRVICDTLNSELPTSEQRLALLDLASALNEMARG